jgi:hypothetical protein
MLRVNGSALRAPKLSNNHRIRGDLYRVHRPSYRVEAL